jgi:hypothetical protein
MVFLHADSLLCCVPYSVVEKDGHIAALQKEVEAMLGSNTRLRTEVKHWEAENLSLRSAAVESEKTLDSVQGTSRITAQRSEHMSADLQAAKRKIDVLTRQLEELRLSKSKPAEEDPVGAAALRESTLAVQQLQADKQELETRLDRVSMLLQVQTLLAFCHSFLDN